MGKITESYKVNFDTLCKAMINDDVCLLDAQRVATNESVVLVCAVNWVQQEDGEREAQFIPLAVMIDGDPFEQYNPPDPIKGGYFKTNEVAH